ncbi:DNA cytosine methyltransferase [Gloeobacter morelensis]|uniref:DNA cytosine methyltransferase n=1 Tax=Gloeobacter morelensis TaxID=2907343 RepID=UPI001E3A97B6|nr:DNA cytosine methyltransferase [Gloeobacter morelensis]UFP97180.1 DNA cytosine methyltransferase [Gloeobacter morelensis MG652769]
MPPRSSFVTVTDQFCGAGGSSLGAVAAGAELHMALNHWKLAIETHNANFQDARHDCTDISACNPRRYTSTDILLSSPECTNHSLAKGKRRKHQGQQELFSSNEPDPAEERSRATMWDVPRFAEYHDYRIVVVENVIDVRHWQLYDAWLQAMHLLNYEHKELYLNSMFFWPTPQSRDRLYVVFWKRGNKTPRLDFTPLAFCAGENCSKDVHALQVWKNPYKRWGKYAQQYTYNCPRCGGRVTPYYFCAANAIDWSLPCPRIGDRKRPLKEKTLARIRAGLKRYGRPPQLVSTNYFSERSRGIQEPLPTQTGAIKNALVVTTSHGGDLDRVRSTVDPHLCVPPAWLVGNYSPGWVRGVEQPTGTATTSDHHALLTAPFLASYYGGSDLVRPVEQAMGTISTHDRHALVAPPPFLVSYYGGRHGTHSLQEPVPTQATMPLHYLALPESIAIDDCGFRMLVPHEIGSAMAFPDTYKVLGNGRQKVRQYGNAVTPPVMEWILARCIESLASRGMH